MAEQPDWEKVSRYFSEVGRNEAMRGLKKRTPEQYREIAAKASQTAAKVGKVRKTPETPMNNLRTSRRKMLLLVEDDDRRAAAIKACIPPDIHCVWTKSAGAALGVLRRDKFSGIMLDFDLYRSAHGDLHLTGESVAAGICETQSRHCEIFIHSQNPSGARRAFELLKQSGFSVEQCPWSTEAAQPLKCWLEELSGVG